MENEVGAVIWIVITGIVLLLTAIGMPIVQAKNGSIKSFGIKSIMISFLLMLACILLMILHCDEGFNTIIFAGEKEIDVIFDILLPMFSAFTMYFLLLGIFFPERYFERKREEREKK